MEDILRMPLAVQERMNSTLQLYNQKCKDESKEAMMKDYVAKGENFSKMVYDAFDGTEAKTQEYIRETHAKLKKAFEEFDQSDIQVRVDMCKKEGGKTAAVFVKLGSSTDAKEIAIPQLNYNYAFKCNGKEAPEHMVEWMKREPHYDDTDKKCVIVDKSLFCISGTASGSVFTAGQKLSKEFTVFLVDSTTGWACIGRKKCESLWDTIQQYSAMMAQAMLSALKMAISAAVNVLNYLVSKVVKLNSRVMGSVKSSSKYLFKLKFKALLILVTLVTTGVIAREAVPALITQLGLEPFQEAASLVNTNKVLSQHLVVLPEVIAASIPKQIPAADTVAKDTMLGLGALMTKQLNENVTFFTHVQNVFNFTPKFTDKENKELYDQLKNLTKVPLPRAPPFLPSPSPSSPSPPSDFGGAADKVFRDITVDNPPRGVFTWDFNNNWLVEKIGADNVAKIALVINTSLISYLTLRMTGGDWPTGFSLSKYVVLPGFSTVYNMFATLRRDPAFPAAVEKFVTTAATAAAEEMKSSVT